jgi:endonuclease/exonuclease/phosphatase family metal-dependent hydrolase
MRIESLNVWGGKVLLPFIRHIEAQAPTTDIFCLQEMFNGAKVDKSRVMFDAILDIHSAVADLLPNHEGYFAPSHPNEEGLSLFIRKEVPVRRVGDVFVYRWQNAMENNDARTLGRNLQYVTFDHNGREFTVMNFHGLWNGQGKTDTEDRLLQSRNIKAFMDTLEGGKILAGDFNLLPKTESLAILEEGMRNLVTEYGVTSTRSSLYTKPEKYADYILVSPDVTVNGFRVNPDEVSDHLALELDFD